MNMFYFSAKEIIRFLVIEYLEISKDKIRNFLFSLLKLYELKINSITQSILQWKPKSIVAIVISGSNYTLGRSPDVLNLSGAVC